MHPLPKGPRDGIFGHNRLIATDPFAPVQIAPRCPAPATHSTRLPDPSGAASKAPTMVSTEGMETATRCHRPATPARPLPGRRAWLRSGRTEWGVVAVLTARRLCHMPRDLCLGLTRGSNQVTLCDSGAASRAVSPRGRFRDARLVGRTNPLSAYGAERQRAPARRHRAGIMPSAPSSAIVAILVTACGRNAIKEVSDGKILQTSLPCS